MAPREGFEPPTKRLTAACSTTELPGNMGVKGWQMNDKISKSPFAPIQAGHLYSKLEQIVNYFLRIFYR
jgi:hypothetical protein